METLPLPGARDRRARLLAAPARRENDSTGARHFDDRRLDAECSARGASGDRRPAQAAQDPRPVATRSAEDGVTITLRFEAAVCHTGTFTARQGTTSAQQCTLVLPRRATVRIPDAGCATKSYLVDDEGGRAAGGMERFSRASTRRPPGVRTDSGSACHLQEDRRALAAAGVENATPCRARRPSRPCSARALSCGCRRLDEPAPTIHGRHLVGHGRC